MKTVIKIVLMLGIAFPTFGAASEWIQSEINRIIDNPDSLVWLSECLTGKDVYPWGPSEISVGPQRYTWYELGVAHTSLATTAPVPRDQYYSSLDFYIEADTDKPDVIVRTQIYFTREISSMSIYTVTACDLWKLPGVIS